MQELSFSKGGKNTKIHATIDEKCRPIKIVLSADNVNDIKIVTQFLDSITLNDRIIMADKTYCSRKFLNLIKIKGEM